MPWPRKCGGGTLVKWCRSGRGYKELRTASIGLGFFSLFVVHKVLYTHPPSFYLEFRALASESHTMQLQSILFLLGLTAPGALAAIGSACSGTEGSGTCQSTSNCSGKPPRPLSPLPDIANTLSPGFTITGACPNDPNDVKCCIQKTCAPPQGSGKCRNTSSGCSGGVFYSGYCPGDSSIQCCVVGGAPVGTGALVLSSARTQAGVPYSWGGGGCSGKSLGIDQGASSKSPSLSLSLK